MSDAELALTLIAIWRLPVKIGIRRGSCLAIDHRSASFRMAALRLAAYLKRSTETWIARAAVLISLVEPRTRSPRSSRTALMPGLRRLPAIDPSLARSFDLLLILVATLRDLLVGFFLDRRCLIRFAIWGRSRL